MVKESMNEDVSADGVELNLEAEAVPSQEEILKDQLLRLAADFENFRKRSRKEQEDIRKFGIERFILDILPVVDNMDRALAHAGDKSDPLVDGIRMIVKQFRDTFLRHGIREVESLGTQFNPELHEALGQQPSADHPAGTILQELEKGYTIHERLLRPARVIVSLAPSDN